jgi:hypothetical protein
MAIKSNVICQREFQKQVLATPFADTAHAWRRDLRNLEEQHLTNCRAMQLQTPGRAHSPARLRP